MEKKSDEIVLSYYDCLLCKSDVALLAEPNWLNDAIIGFYFEYLDHKFNRDEQKDLLFVNPAVTQLLKMTDISEYEVFLDPSALSNAHAILFALNNCDQRYKPGGSHWSLLVYCQSDSNFYHFDSCNGTNRDIALRFAKALSSYMHGSDQCTFKEPNSPQQDNGYDCGIYVMCLTDIILESVIKTKELNGCNFEHAKQLAKTKRTEVLELITSLSESSSSK